MYAILVALVMMYFNPMTWFSHKSLLLPLYYLPSVFGVVIGQHVFYRYH